MVRAFPGPGWPARWPRGADYTRHVSRTARAIALPAPLARIRLPGDRSWLVLLPALFCATLVGVALAIDVPLGIALLIAVCYVPILLVNLPLAIALWVPLIFLQGVPALNFGSDVAGILLIVAWLGNRRALRDLALPIIREHRGTLTGLAGLIAWLTISLAWADDPALASDDVVRWGALALLFLVVATTVTTTTSIRWVCLFFVAGAAMSVVLGVLDGSLTSAVEGGARVEGGAGDPNFLASSIIAAVALAGGVLPGTRQPVIRLALLAAIVLLVAGLVGSGSRGGTLAAAVAMVAAVIVFKGRRAPVIAAAAVLVSIAALTFASAPAAYERVTDFDNDNGRSDLWYIAWEMGKDRPVNGVGLNNFTLHSGDYVQEPGQLQAVGNIVEDPHFVHNTYLQLFAEGGIPALALFLVVVSGCLGAAIRAGEAFQHAGDASLEILARSIVVGIVSILAAGMFLSAELDARLWLLLALGPGLLAAATTRSRRATATAQLASEGAAERPLARTLRRA